MRKRRGKVPKAERARRIPPEGDRRRCKCGATEKPWCIPLPKLSGRNCRDLLAAWHVILDLALLLAKEVRSIETLCVPKIRFCNIDGEGRQGQVVRRPRRGAQSRDGEGRPCSEIDGSSTHHNRRHIRVGSGAGALRQTRSCGRDIRGGSIR